MCLSGYHDEPTASSLDGVNFPSPLHAASSSRSYLGHGIWETIPQAPSPTSRARSGCRWHRRHRSGAMSVSAAMGDAIPEQPAEEQQSPRTYVPSPRRIVAVLTPRRVAAVIALVFLAVRLRRQIRLARLAIRHRRRLRLALSVLVFLRQVRRSRLLGR